jgi:cell division protein FtsQ
VQVRRAASGLALLAAVTVPVWLVVLFLDRPIETVTVEGPFERVPVIQVEAAVGDLQEAGFLSVDLEAVVARIEAIDWVDAVIVRRRWPGTLFVRIVEQVPAARWGDDGLLNTRGELFVEHARHVPMELPRLSGPEGSQTTVAERYLELRNMLAKGGFSLKALSLDARGAWKFTLGGGVEVRVGRDAVAQRLRRFERYAAPLITDRMAEVAYVDLRYTRGFAIGWADRGDGKDGKSKETKADV